MPPNKPLFDDDDDQTQASTPGDLPPGFGDDDDDKTTLSNPKDLPFKPIADEDDEHTMIDPPRPAR
jgi:hypothetical protein